MTRHTMTVDPDGTERLDGAPTGRCHGPDAPSLVVSFEASMTGAELAAFTESISAIWGTLDAAIDVSKCESMATWPEYREGREP